MVNRLYKLTALIFLLFSGFTVSARGGLYHFSHKEDKKPSISATTAHHLPYNPFNYEYILNNVPIQILSPQQHRGAHTLQGMFTSPNFLTIQIKYLSFICGGGSSELSRFRKLILFPFHNFW